jgi:hypothetical protein
MTQSLSAGKEVIVGVDLEYIAMIGASDGHAIVVHGFEIVEGQQYVDITNGWPDWAPITRIPSSQFVKAWSVCSNGAVTVSR